LMFTAQEPGHGPFVIRYPRGKGVIADWHKPMTKVEVGTGVCLREGNDIAVLSIGPIGNKAAKAIDRAEAAGLSVAHYDMRFLKPLDEKILHEVGRKFKKVVTVEDGVREGGFGSAVLEFFADNGYSLQVKRIGLPDSFVEHGTPDELYSMLGMNEEGISKVLMGF